MDDHALLQALWRGYARITPQAEHIGQLWAQRGDQVVQDHIALRTFGLPDVGLEKLAEPFLARGFRARESYRFPEKRLRARYYEKPGRPKVFISEFEVDSLPPGQASLVRALVDSLPEGFTQGEAWIYGGRPWSLSRAQYLGLAEVSEYASWVAAHGFCANHFTVAVDALDSVGGLAELVDVLQASGVALNGSGGVIKGGAEVHLAQASTLAETTEVDFSDGPLRVPGCYVEFAQRFPLPNGERFEGFVARSADRIFESTDRQA